tara:strand:+ start:147 stop:452 length:306 start_codon:yes stop_codon:yes gene_type:complete
LSKLLIINQNKNLARKKPPNKSNVNKIANKLKYLSMNSFMGFPNFHISAATRKNLADLLIVEAIKNKRKLMSKAPAVIVKILKGIGVNPAVNMIQKFHCSY